MTSCSSSVSVQRSTKSEDHRSKSCDTVCTSNSSCFLQRRKPMNPLMYPVRPTYSRSTGNTVRQRVLSAKLLKLRSLQNQLSDANYHLTEIAKENQILKNLQKRQDKALSKYEDMNEDLPRLLHSHEEQLRILTEKNKSLRRNMKDLNDILKSKEEELLKAQEKLSRLEKLNRDKHLTDREKLTDQLEDMKLKLQKSEEQIAFLNRKLMLETKTSKQRVNAEMAKHKQCQRELDKALGEINRLTGLLEAKENVVHPRKNRFTHHSVSMVTLGNYPPPNRMRSSEKLETIDDAAEKHPQKAPVTDIKLEPIKCKPEMNPRKANGILDANPAENIKNRLSSASARSKDSTESSPSNRGKARSSGSEISLENTPGDSEANGLDSDSPRGGNMEDLRSESDEKLEKLAKNLDAAIQRATDNTNEDFEQKLGEHCSNLMGSVRSCSERLDAQKESLKISRDDTAAIAEAFKKTQKIEASLKSSFLSVEDANMDFLSEILSEELKFQATNKPTDRNGNVKEPKVNLEEKKKLLATLKAIDNGDNVESIGNSPPHGQTNLMKEIFGDVSK